MASANAPPGAVRSFRKNIRALERQIGLSLSAQTACCGVTPAQCHVLLEVAERGEPSVGEIAAALELDASTLSRAVDGLARQGFLGRREDPDNRRRYLVGLRPAGKRKVAEIDALCDEYYSGFLSALEKEERELVLGVLPRFVEAFGAWRAAERKACCRAEAAGEKA